MARQLARWVEQCGRATVPLPAAMEELAASLPAHVPANAMTRLVHGDFRIDNLVFHPAEPRVIGVLDWELSTLGDPLVSYHCMAWRVTAALWLRSRCARHTFRVPVPGRLRATGIAVRDMDFYMAYNLFRMAAILHGIAQRAAEGTAASPDAAATGAKAGPLAELGLTIARRLASA